MSAWVPATYDMEQASAARELFLRSAGIGRSLLDNIIEAYGTPAFTADIARLASHVPASTDRKAEPIPYPQTASTLARLYLCIAKIYILEDIGYNRELQSKARRAGHRVDNTCNLRYQRIYGGGILREMVEIEVDVLCRLESTRLQIKFAALVDALRALRNSKYTLLGFEEQGWVGVERAHNDVGKTAEAQVRDEDEHEDEGEEGGKQSEKGLQGGDQAQEVKAHSGV